MYIIYIQKCKHEHTYIYIYISTNIYVYIYIYIYICIQPIVFGVSFKLDLQSQSRCSFSINLIQRDLEHEIRDRDLKMKKWYCAYYVFLCICMLTCMSTCIYTCNIIYIYIYVHQFGRCWTIMRWRSSRNTKQWLSLAVLNNNKIHSRRCIYAYTLHVYSCKHDLYLCSLHTLCMYTWTHEDCVCTHGNMNVHMQT